MTKKKKKLGLKTQKNVLTAIKPSKGYKFLEDTEDGDYFETRSLRGVKLQSGPMGTRVIILSAKVDEEDESYYLGKQLIANKTEVRR